MIEVMKRHMDGSRHVSCTGRGTDEVTAERDSPDTKQAKGFRLDSADWTMPL